MPIQHVVITDNEDNTQYPHTEANVVFFSDANAINLVTKNTKFEFVVNAEKYEPTQYEIGGYVRASEIWFTGEYFTQKHYLGSKVNVIPGHSYNVTITKAMAEVSDMKLLILKEDMTTLECHTLVPVTGTDAVTLVVDIPTDGKIVLLGVTGDIKDTRRRVAKNVTIIDISESSKNVEEFRNDTISGKQVVGRTDRLNGVSDTDNYKIIVSKTQPTPIPGVKIIWIKDK